MRNSINGLAGLLLAGTVFFGCSSQGTNNLPPWTKPVGEYNLPQTKSNSPASKLTVPQRILDEEKNKKIEIKKDLPEQKSYDVKVSAPASVSTPTSAPKLNLMRESQGKDLTLVTGRINCSFPKFGGSDYAPQVGEGIALYRKGEGDFGIEIGLDNIKYKKRDGTDSGSSTLATFNLLYFPENQSNWFVGAGAGLKDSSAIGGATTGYILGGKDISGVFEANVLFPLKFGGFSETMVSLYAGVGVKF